MYDKANRILIFFVVAILSIQLELHDLGLALLQAYHINISVNITILLFLRMEILVSRYNNNTFLETIV